MFLRLSFSIFSFFFLLLTFSFLILTYENIQWKVFLKKENCKRTNLNTFLVSIIKTLIRSIIKECSASSVSCIKKNRKHKDWYYLDQNVIIVFEFHYMDVVTHDFLSLPCRHHVICQYYWYLINGPKPPVKMYHS